MTTAEAWLAQRAAQLTQMEAQVREGQLQAALVELRYEQATNRCNQMTQRYWHLQGVLQAMTAAATNTHNGQPLPIFMRLHLLASKYSMCTRVTPATLWLALLLDSMLLDDIDSGLPSLLEAPFVLMQVALAVPAKL